MLFFLSIHEFYYSQAYRSISFVGAKQWTHFILFALNEFVMREFL